MCCPQGLRLATVTLINPDTSLREFRLVGEALVQLCPLVTVYGDRKDVALTGASIVLGIHNAYVSSSHCPCLTLVASRSAVTAGMVWQCL